MDYVAMSKRIVAGLLGSLLLSPLAEARVPYRATDLGVPSVQPPHYDNQAHDLSDAGHVVGATRGHDAWPDHGYIWTTKAGLRDLGPNTIWGSANKHGDVAGGIYAQKANGQRYEIPALPGGRYSFRNTYDLNDHFQVVGASRSGSGSSDVAFIWDEVNGTREIGLVPGDDWSRAYAINNKGEVAGSSERKAFVWSEDKGMRVIEPPENHADIRARDINDAGQVVGEAKSDWSSGISYFNQALIWTESEGIEWLGFLPGWDSSIATAINNDGMVVGFGTHVDYSAQAFVWTREDGMSLVQDLLADTDPLKTSVDFEMAFGVNNHNEFLVRGRTSDGLMRSYLFSPVPEPETYVAMLAGLAFLGWVLKRRRL